ncbi:hypothetical protein AMK26_26910 [Streptomyces sp. CB03234]|uniref:hypothetical protein n=1 Tax=Streptomyces sp. (strain CB03234) TaxID=1703937 RepID=UPI00093E64D6|nr:hypothetical protein [Streptomyces sp. CB03234]OKJ99648.1 hypothetical protein AMK26_26910 [Streptomyces sp. CB03234]
MRTAPAPGPRDSKTESAPKEEKNPQNPRNTQSADSTHSTHSADGPDSPAHPASPKKRTPALIFDDPLDQQSADDTDRGWGERPPAGDSAADLARFLDEKPPHHL